jgi:hypothetical protein
LSDPNRWQPHTGLLLLAVEWGAVLGAAVLLALRLTAPDPRIGDDDFQVFYAGAAALRIGGSVYVGDFVSPPWFALLILPLVWLPLEAARGIWLALNLGLLYLAVVLSASLAQLQWPARRLLLAALLCGLWPPVEFGLKLGQNSLLAWVFLLAALRAASLRRPATCGALLALALVKPQLAFLFAGGLFARAVRQREWWPLAGAALATIVALAVAVALVAPASYADLLVLRPRPWNYWESNVALPALLAWLLGDQGWALGLYLALAIAASGVVIALWATRLEDFAWLAAMTACVTLLVSPYAYPYDAVLLVLPALWVVGRVREGAVPQPRWWPLLAAGILLGLWLFERTADYSPTRFLSLLPPLALGLLVLMMRRVPER